MFTNRFAFDGRGLVGKTTGRICARSMALITIISVLACCRGGIQSAVKKQEEHVETVEQASAFGYKCGWLAIRSSAPNEVTARLGIRDVRQAPWRDGIEAAYERSDDRIVYVTPPIDGWVLVVGTSLFSAVGEMREDGARFPDYVAALSGSLATVVQYFATHRVSEAHAWILAERGKLVRAYGVGDNEVEFDKGEHTAAENELGINFDLHAEGPRFSKENPQPFREWMSHQVDEKMVMRVASRWSIDPQTLEQRRLPQGWLGIYRP